MTIEEKYKKETGNEAYGSSANITGFIEWIRPQLEQTQEVGRVDVIVIQQKDEVINKLRGQLQNCINYLHNAKRNSWSGANFDEVIDQANKTLYETSNITSK